jgi:hypothetical protein
MKCYYQGYTIIKKTSKDIYYIESIPTATATSLRSVKSVIDNMISSN